MTVADLAIIAGLVFAWGTLPARLERFDVTAPIVFTAAGVLLTHGLLAPLGITPGSEVVKVLAEATPPPRPGEIPERRLIRQPAQGTGKLLMTADQIPLRAGRRRRAGFPRVRAR